MTNQEERMDAMTPSREVTPEDPGTPTALRFMGETIARQVELGIVIEQAHQSEIRAHRNAKLRLSNMETSYRRLQNFNEEVNSRLDLVREATVGGHIYDGVTVSPDGDVVAEVRELWAKAYNLERELLEAKALLESATAQNANWEEVRRNWYERVRMILHSGSEPQTEDNPWGLPAQPQIPEDREPEPDDEDEEEF